MARMHVTHLHCTNALHAHADGVYNGPQALGCESGGGHVKVVEAHQQQHACVTCDVGRVTCDV